MTTGSYSQNPSVSDDGFNLDIGRITRIVSTVAKDPESGWPQIQEEYGTVKSLFLNFILPLLALTALCNLINVAVFGMMVPESTTAFKTPMGIALVGVVIFIISKGAMLYIGGMILAKLAPTFNGNTTDLRCMRLLAFAYGLSWIASIATLIPIIGWLVALAASIYGLYLFYKGIPVMTSVPAEKTLMYAIVSIIIMIVVGFLIATLTAGMTGAALMASV